MIHGGLRKHIEVKAKIDIWAVNSEGNTAGLPALVERMQTCRTLLVKALRRPAARRARIANG